MEMSTRLRPYGEGRQDHDADTLDLIHWVVNVHTTNFASWVIFLVPLLVSGDSFITKGVVTGLWCLGGRTRGLGELLEFGFLLRGRNLVEVVFFRASQVLLLHIPNELFCSTDVTGFLTFRKIFDLHIIVQPHM